MIKNLDGVKKVMLVPGETDMKLPQRVSARGPVGLLRKKPPAAERTYMGS